MDYLVSHDYSEKTIDKLEGIDITLRFNLVRIGTTAITTVEQLNELLIKLPIIRLKGTIAINEVVSILNSSKLEREFETIDTQKYEISFDNNRTYISRQYRSEKFFSEYSYDESGYDGADFEGGDRIKAIICKSNPNIKDSNISVDRGDKLWFTVKIMCDGVRAELVNKK